MSSHRSATSAETTVCVSEILYLDRIVAANEVDLATSGEGREHWTSWAGAIVIQAIFDSKSCAIIYVNLICGRAEVFIAADAQNTAGNRDVPVESIGTAKTDRAIPGFGESTPLAAHIGNRTVQEVGDAGIIEYRSAAADQEASPGITIVSSHEPQSSRVINR